MSCIFCEIIARRTSACFVHEDESVSVFLDHRPLFPGHCLVVPRAHVETLWDLDRALIEPVFATAKRVARAVKDGLGADGAFVAINNVVSQSVPHLHVHVIPRRRGDGLKGFFWPRKPYDSPAHMDDTRARIAAALREVKP